MGYYRLALHAYLFVMIYYVKGEYFNSAIMNMLRDVGYFIKENNEACCPSADRHFLE